jgi:predicted amidohydrolase
VKVAAYQAPLLDVGSMAAIDLIRDQVRRCKSAGVEILCCPEAILGGLADYVSRPFDIAIRADRGQLHAVLAPLASERVTTILGFTEQGPSGSLFNSAAVFHRGEVIGIYRKRHPAGNRSIYEAGRDTPVFTVGGLTFGIVICRDSTFPEPARIMMKKGALALFVPTNNGLPPAKAGVEVVEDGRNADIARAAENAVSVIRADVAGRAGGLVAYGSSAIVDHRGAILQAAGQLEVGLLVADIDLCPRRIALAAP